MDEHRAARIPCQGCMNHLTWAEQRQQYGRAIKRYGLTPEEAKKLMPLCGKCLTAKLGKRTVAATP